jgi:hypothetical protein
MGQTVPTSGQGLMCDWIIMILEAQPKHTLEDSGEGLATRRLKFIGEIPDSAINILNNSLTLLEGQGIITREIRGRRTFKIQLNTSAISAHDADRLIAHAADIQDEMRKRFPLSEKDKLDRISELPFFKPLLADCKKVLAALQETAAKCTPAQRAGKDLYKINGKAVLEEAGFSWARAKVVVHYLANLGLADIQRSVSTKTWIWKITDKQIPGNATGLRRIILREGKTLYTLPSPANYRPEEDTKGVRRYARGTPSVLPDSLCGPIQVTKVNQEAEATMEETDVEPTPAPEPIQIDEEKPVASPADVEKPTPVRQLIAIIERLERKIKALQAGNEAKDEEIRLLKLDKKELEEALGIALENSSQDKADAEVFLKKYNVS